MLIYIARPIDQQFVIFDIKNESELITQIKKKWMYASISKKFQLCEEETMKPFWTLNDSKQKKLKNGMKLYILFDNEMVPFEKSKSKYNLRSSSNSPPSSFSLKKNYSTANIMTLTKTPSPTTLKRSSSFSHLFLKQSCIIESAKGMVHEYPWKNRKMETQWKQKTALVQIF